MMNIFMSDQLTRDILHSPEVQWQEKNNTDKAPDEAVAVPPTQQIHKKGQTSEDQVEKCDHWVFQSSGSGLVETFKGAIVHEGTVSVIHVSVITQFRE